VWNQDEGYIPRVFFLHPKDDSPLDLAIVGGNPGHADKVELKWNKEIWRQKKNERDAYRNLVQKHWRKFPDAPRSSDHYRPFYEKPLQFLKALNSDETIFASNGILYLEVVFCETKSGSNNISDTVVRCTSEFLKRRKMLDLLSRCKHILCLGFGDSFNPVTELRESNQWKVIGLYHPTPGNVRQPYSFNNYFEDPKRRTKLEPIIVEKLKEFENMQKPYQVEVKVRSDGSPFVRQVSQR